MAEPFRPNLFQHASSRVSSEPQPAPSSSSKRSHLHSLHHHPHRHHHHHRHSSRHHAKEAVQSAIQLHPPTSFGDLLKQAKGSKETTPSQSRRESVRENGGLDRHVIEALERREVRKPVRPEDVERERKKVKAREEELRSSLQNLSDQSLKTSRRLDDTYYSILEKVSILRQTIGSLQELSGLTKELHENFQSDTKELAEDVQGQFEGFNNFDSQQEQVTALEARIKAGKEKADALNARLTEAQTRVQARAKSEAELEARNTRRLRILWGIIGAIAGLIVVAILFQQFKPIHPDAPRAGLDFASRAKIMDAPIPDIAKEALMSSSRSNIRARMHTSVARPATELEDDHRLRAFDEL